MNQGRPATETKLACPPRERWQLARSLASSSRRKRRRVPPPVVGWLAAYRMVLRWPWKSAVFRVYGDVLFFARGRGFTEEEEEEDVPTKLTHDLQQNCSTGSCPEQTTPRSKAPASQLPPSLALSTRRSPRGLATQCLSSSSLVSKAIFRVTV